MDWKLELVIIPVSDIDRAKDFYVDKVGFHADFDQTVSEAIRFGQLTPPGSVKGLQIVVADVRVARAQLVERGVDVTPVQDLAWGSFVYFADPDGNRWTLQQVPARN
ncbi:MAG: VOC family protein [Candidatus Dormibacter sp.]